MSVIQSQTSYRILFEEFGDVVDLERDPSADQASIQPMVDVSDPELMQDEIADEEELECIVANEIEPPGPASIDPALLERIAAQLEQLHADAARNINQLSEFLCFVMLTTLEALATNVAARPKPKALPEIAAMLQQAAGIHMPLKIEASAAQCDALHEIFRSSAGVELTPSTVLSRGEVVVSWSVCQARWMPDSVLTDMQTILRQYGLAPPDASSAGVPLPINQSARQGAEHVR